jgi:hypothetical protein
VVAALIALVVGLGLGFLAGRLSARGRSATGASPLPAPAPEEAAEASVQPDPTAVESVQTEPPVPVSAVDAAPGEDDSNSSEAIDERMDGVLSELERRYQGRRAQSEEVEEPASRRARRKRR